MAVTFRSAGANSAATSATASVSRPAGVVAGDLLIAVLGSDQDGSLGAMTAPAGWTEVGSDARTGVGFVKVWTKIAGGSEPASYAFPDSTGADSSLAVIAVTGADPGVPLAVTPVFDGSATATTAHPAPSVIGTAGGLLVTAHFAGGSTNTNRTYTPPSGMQERADTTGGGWTALEVNTLDLAAGGATGTRTATCSVSTRYTTLSLVVAPATGSGGGSGSNVTFRAATEDARGTAGNPCAPVLPAGVVAGDLLLCVHTCDLNGSLAGLTADTGWTELPGSGSRTDVGFMKVWQKVAGSSEPASYSFTSPVGSDTSAVIVAATGQGPNAPLAVQPTYAAGASATAHPAPSVAGVAGGLLLTAHLAGTTGSSRTYTAPSGLSTAKTSVLSTSPNILTGVFYQQLAAGGQTGAKSATCSGSTPYVTMALVVAPITTATAVTPDVADATGKANDATAGSASRAVATAGNATGKANNPTVAGSSQVTAAAQRASATGSASTSSTSTSSTISTRVIAGLAGATAAAVGSNTGAASGFQVTAATPPGAAGVFPSDTLFPSGTLFPSDGAGAAPQNVTGAGAIPSAEAFGSPVVTTADGPLFVQAAGIASAEAFGVPTVTMTVGPQDVTAVGGIGSEEAFGRPTVTPEVASPPPAPHFDYLDTYYVDGVDLSTYTTQIEVGEGLQDTPGTVGDSVALPGMDGLLEVFGGPGQPRRPDGVGKLTLDMWLIGVDPDTGELLDRAGSAQAYQQRWDELVRMFHRRRVTVDHPRQDGTRRALAYISPGETMAPSNRSASPWFGRFRVSLTIPGAHWTDTFDVTTGPTTLATNGMLDLSPWSSATAPCTELTITFGPGNNPRLSTSYGFVGYNGVIAAGRQLTIDTATGQLGTGSGQLWTPSYDGLIYSPGPRLFEIDPSEPLQAILTHTTGGTMSVEVAGKRRYRTS